MISKKVPLVQQLTSSKVQKQPYVLLLNNTFIANHEIHIYIFIKSFISENKQSVE